MTHPAETSRAHRPDTHRLCADLERHFRGSSARALAGRAGWGRTTVTEIVNGRKLPSAAQLRDILMAADTAPDELRSWLERLHDVIDVGESSGDGSQRGAVPGPGQVQAGADPQIRADARMDRRAASGRRDEAEWLEGFDAGQPRGRRPDWFDRGAALGAAFTLGAVALWLLATPLSRTPR